MHHRTGPYLYFVTIDRGRSHRVRDDAGPASTSAGRRVPGERRLVSRALPRRGAAVLGSPIAHSLSPALHHAAYDALGLPDWSYRAVECGADESAGDAAGAGCRGAGRRQPDDAVEAGRRPVARRHGRLGRRGGGGEHRALRRARAVERREHRCAGHGLGAALDRVRARGGTRRQRCRAALGARRRRHRLRRTGCAGPPRARACGRSRARARRPQTRCASSPSGPGSISRFARWSEISMAAEAPLVVATTPAGATDGLAAALPAVRRGSSSRSCTRPGRPGSPGPGPRPAGRWWAGSSCLSSRPSSRLP